MWIFREITDAMFFLACGNHPVKTDCVCEFADTHYHHHYYDSIKFSSLQIRIFFNLVPFAAALKLTCDHAQFCF